MVTARAEVVTQAGKTRARVRGSKAQSGLGRGLTAGRAQTTGAMGAVAQGSATAAAEARMAQATAVVTRAQSWCARGRCRWQWRLE